MQSEFSAGVMLALQVAVAEALASGFQYVEREHMMVALSRLTSFSDGDLATLNLPAATAALIRQESERLLACFSRFQIQPEQLGQKLRRMLGYDGGAPNVTDHSLHRSESCRQAFRRASELAGPQGCPQAIHLLAGLLHSPSSRIAQAIVSQGVHLDQFRDDVRQQCDSPRSAVPVPAGLKRKTGALDRFGTDLTALAREGKIEPLVGRRAELLNLMRTLVRKSKCNPILVGEPGVGKTAVVRALAERISSGNVIRELRSVRLVELNLAAMIAGAKYRGDFEERWNDIIADSNNDPNLVLFIDEIHTLVGAGSGGGSLDAANMLKPALLGGNFRCIGATTLTEYSRYFGKDPALARRFQPIRIGEPTEDETVAILAQLREKYERHHGIEIPRSVLKTLVGFTVNFVQDRRLPDKALDLLDECCARLKVSTLTNRTAESPRAISVELAAQVISEWTGIPAGSLTLERQQYLAGVLSFLSARVMGQEEAVLRVSSAMKVALAGLRDASRPKGVFLFLGPTGVGKTELARSVAAFLFGSPKELIRFDMSEYQEQHSISRLIGSPPGYVGFEEEGQLTGALRHKPHSVVLLDEVEKAHPKLLDVFLQLFDEGRLTDGQGRTVDGRHAFFILTSNALAAENAEDVPMGFAAPNPNPEAKPRDPAQRLVRFFRPEFINRLDDVILFRPLEKSAIRLLARKMLRELSDRVSGQTITIHFTEPVEEMVAEAGYDPRFGARQLARVIDRLVARPLSEFLLAGNASAGDMVGVYVVSGKIELRLMCEGGEMTL